MAKSKLVKVNEKIADEVVSDYKKIEDGVVSTYKKIEDGFVDGFNKILIYSDNGQRTLGAAIKEAFSILGNYEQVDKFNHLQERLF